MSTFILPPPDDFARHVLFMSTIVLVMRTHDTALSHLLFGQTRGRILATLYDKPETAFFVRQLARHIAGSVGTVQRELTTLTAAGLILRTEGENQVFYRANRDHPIFAELHALLAKTTGVFHLLQEALAPLADNIEFAFVYGSFARGEEKGESDVDLMVIGEVTLDDLLEQVSPLEPRLSRPINPTIYARGELRTKLHAGNHFLKAIQNTQLIFLIGNENEFREIC
jgi:predicted nucleotidyltransferase